MELKHDKKFIIASMIKMIIKNKTIMVQKIFTKLLTQSNMEPRNFFFAHIGVQSKTELYWQVIGKLQIASDSSDSRHKRSLNYDHNKKYLHREEIRFHSLTQDQIRNAL